MDDLIAFLRARLDEQHAGVDEVHERSCDLLTDSWPVSCDCGEPEWQLADVAAKRKIIELVFEGFHYGDACSDDVFRRLLRALALPYADHPDYRQEWRP